MTSENPNKGKRALVTGASSGIGAVYADRLAREGYDVVLVARREDRLVDLAARLKNDYKVEVINVVADLSKSEGLERVEEYIAGDSAIEMLVNNAGQGVYKPLAETPTSDVDEMVLLNVLALTRLTHAVLPQMLARQSGAIINIAGGLGFVPSATRATYGASKAYGILFSRSLHDEVHDKGIKVQAACPGLTYSDFHQRSGTDISKMPPEIIMTAEDFVDGSLAGLRLGEVVCCPGLQDISNLGAWEAASTNLRNGMMHNKPAARYGVA